MASAGQLVGIFIACGAAAAALLTPNPRWRYRAIAIALMAAVALIFGQVWNTPRFADLRGSPAEAAAVVVGAAVLVILLAWVFHRWRWAFPLCAFAVIGLRVSITVGGQSSSLLIPLYGVTASAALAMGAVAWRRGPDPTMAISDAGRWRGLALPWLPRILAAYLVLYALQATYSEDPSNAVENAAFFLVPFAVLFVLLIEVKWTPWLLARVLAVTAAVALALVALAIGEYASRHLILNPDLVQENAIHLYYRVNSLFRDPNVFGRYVALAMVALGDLPGLGTARAPGHGERRFSSASCWPGWRSASRSRASPPFSPGCSSSSGSVSGSRGARARSWRWPWPEASSSWPRGRAVPTSRTRRT